MSNDDNREYRQAVDSAVASTGVKYTRSITNFYDLVRADIEEKMKGASPCEEATLCWVLSRIDVAEKMIMQILERNIAKYKDALVKEREKINNG